MIHTESQKLAASEIVAKPCTKDSLRREEANLARSNDGLQCSQDKIHQGLRVHMDVRGSSALMHVIRALCSVKAGHICEK